MIAILARIIPIMNALTRCGVDSTGLASPSVLLTSSPASNSLGSLSAAASVLLSVVALR